MALFTPGGHLTGILDCDSFRILYPSPCCGGFLFTSAIEQTALQILGL